MLPPGGIASLAATEHLSRTNVQFLLLQGGAGAEVVYEAFGAFGVAGAAVVAAEVDPLMVDVEPVFLGVYFQERLFRFCRGVGARAGEFQAVRDAEYVRVDGG